MKCQALMLLLLFSCLSPLFAQEKLSKHAVLEDLQHLENQLQRISSYQGLNGYNYQIDFERYRNTLSSDSIVKTDFGLFLSKSIGKIGDRHAYVKNYNLADEKFMPFIIAPFENQVLALQYNSDHKYFDYLHANYPYLTAINGMKLKLILAQICPEAIYAPKAAYHARAVKQLRHLEESFAIMNQPLPMTCTFTFSGEKGDTTVDMSILSTANRKGRWSDQFAYLDVRESEMNNTAKIAPYFKVDQDEIAYLRIPKMLHPEDAPNYYQLFHEFMQNIRESKALIIDVRDNGGGGRELILELAKYLVHPDTIQVVNIAQQRSNHNLNEDQKEDMRARFLYEMEALDTEEQAVAKDFLSDFQPMYDLPENQFSNYYFMLLNGEKLNENGDNYFYNQTVFVLANERSFSAASILVSTLKNLPNVLTAGVTTDGSSGNSEKFYLPNSKLKVKISTMVSFQTNGQILDGFGTAPDMALERSLEQVLWKEDNQLKQLKELILTKL
ncbi:MAG: S41 family peptidase [Bacteroidota bacterium]